MNYLDIVLGLPLLYAVYKGFTKGLIISVATLLALILGVYAAIYFSDYFEVYIEGWFHPTPRYLNFISFAATFLIVVILVRLIGWGLDKLISAIALGFVNRLLGVVFSVLKWGFLISVLISIFDTGEHTKSIIDENVKDESVLYRPVSLIAPFIFPYLNFEELKEKVGNIPLEKVS